VEAIARRKSEHATGDDAPVGEVEEGTANLALREERSRVEGGQGRASGLRRASVFWKASRNSCWAATFRRRLPALVHAIGCHGVTGLGRDAVTQARYLVAAG
jgi:hypothetical protein